MSDPYNFRPYLDALKQAPTPSHELLRAIETLKDNSNPPVLTPPELLRTAAAIGIGGSTQPLEKCTALKLQDCVTSGRKLLETNKATKDLTLQWARRVRFALFSMFGKEATVVKDLDILLKDVQLKGLSKDQFAQKISDLESLVDYLNRISGSPLACPVSKISQAPSTKDVFIIHGHDELNTRRLSQLLQGEFGLNPIAMLAKPGMSRPLTQKFEDEAQKCSFAFALFTPDDEIVKSDIAYKQARPNVIYEVGWFIGRLGRARVTLILKSGTKIHSDLDGVSQIHFSEDIAEKFLEIRKELIAARVVQ